MTKAEFLDRVEAILKSEDIKDVKAGISDNDYKTVEFVYVWHPAISEVNGKEQIAKLYVDYGMSLISDMVPCSRLMKDAEQRVLNLQSSLNELKGEMEDIKRGVSLDILLGD